MKTKPWLTEAVLRLQAAGIPSARLDAELLLADTLRKDRTWLIAHPEAIIVDADLKEANDKLERRLSREPLAYIRGYKEFYGRSFRVTPDTLVPRPETEVMIELLAPLVADDTKLVDVGTGSGAIAITAKLQYPALTVEATDVSDAALAVTRKNADILGADIAAYNSDLLADAHGRYHVICANLPYVDAAWQVSDETHYEPDLALYAKDDGLALIKTLVEQSAASLDKNGYLLLEADPRQHDAIIEFGHDHSFDWYQTEGFIVVLQKR